MSLTTAAPNWFDDSETGAPVIDNTPGGLISALKAVAVDGFSVRPIVQIEVADGVATAQCLSHGYSSKQGKLLQVSGSSVPALNGIVQPTAMTANGFSYPAPGVANGVYVGTPSVRRAPLGWEVAHINEAGTVAIFRRPDPAATAYLLRVDDTNPTYARALALESAVGVGDYVAAAPNIGGGYFWSKGTNNATAKKWVVVGNSQMLYLFTERASFTQLLCHWFGDFNSIHPSDPWRCVITGEADTTGPYDKNNTLISRSLPVVFSSNADPAVVRPSSGTPGAARAAMLGAHANARAVGSATYSPVTIAQTPIMASVPLVEEYASAGNPVRGSLAGFAYPLTSLPFTHLDVVTPAGYGRSFLAVNVGEMTVSGAALAQILFDVTGPWHE